MSPLLLVAGAGAAAGAALAAYLTWAGPRDAAHDQADPWTRWDGSRGGEHPWR